MSASVSTAPGRGLPGTPGPLLGALWEGLSPATRKAFRPHLLGFTSAEWLAETFRDEGWQMSATTIRTYRRSLRQTGE